MTAPRITLDNLYEEFFEVFPDLRQEYEADADFYEDEEGRIASAFLTNFLYHCVLLPELREPEPGPAPNERLVKGFGFLELLLTAGDDKVEIVTETSVCEDVALGYPELYERAKPYLGPLTRTICDDYSMG